MYSVVTVGGLRKYTEQLVSHLETPCVVITSLDSAAYAAHWRAPVLKWSAAAHHAFPDKVRLLVRHLHNLVQMIRVSLFLHVRLVHVQEIEPLSLGMLWPLIKSRFRVVLSVHDLVPHKPFPYGMDDIQYKLRRRLYRQADALCIFSQYGAAKLVHEMRVPEERVHVLPLGLNEALPQHPPRRHTRPAKPVFLLFGSYRPNKGFEVLTEAFLQMRWSGQPGLLRVAGKYPQGLITQVLTRYEQAGLAGDIEFINRFIAEEEIDGLMRASDIMVLPYTRFESQSGILYLAYAYNMPIVASSVGGLTEMIEADGTGVLVEPGNVQDLARGLLEVVRQWDGFARVEPAQLLTSRYSWKRIGQLTDAVYTQLLSGDL
jgi:glycosyltransferase involved in cell wall biosynthesis